MFFSFCFEIPASIRLVCWFPQLAEAALELLVVVAVAAFCVEKYFSISLRASFWVWLASFLLQSFLSYFQAWSNFDSWVSFLISLIVFLTYSSSDVEARMSWHCSFMAVMSYVIAFCCKIYCKKNCSNIIWLKSIYWEFFCPALLLICLLLLRPFFIYVYTFSGI